MKNRKRENKSGEDIIYILNFIIFIYLKQC